MHRHCIRQFIANEQGRQIGNTGQRIHPAHASTETRQFLPLHRLVARIWLDDEVVKSTGLQNILRKLAIMRCLLDDGKSGRIAQFLTNLPCQHGEQPAIERPHADRRVKVTTAPDAARPGSIIAMFRMIQGQLHHLGKGQARD